jgi:hypothetical protein
MPYTYRLTTKGAPMPEITLLRRDTTTVTRYKLADCGPVRASYSKRTLQPDYATAVFVEGQFERLTVSGPVLLKNGELSITVRTDRSWSSREQREGKVPDWALPMTKLATDVDGA